MRQWVINGRRVNGLIRRIQSGTITVPNAVSTTLTILAVDVSNSLLRWRGNTTDDANTFASVRDVYLQLTNSTTITATTGNSGNTQVVSYEVIEFWPGVLKSVQRGTVAADGSTSITAVDLNRATLDYLGQGGSGNDTDDKTKARIAYTSATSVGSATGGGVGTSTMAFQAADYF